MQATAKKIIDQTGHGQLVTYKLPPDQLGIKLRLARQDTRPLYWLSFVLATWLTPLPISRSAPWDPGKHRYLSHQVKQELRTDHWIRIMPISRSYAWRSAERMNRRPIPGQEKIVSVNTAPPKSRGKSRARSVTIGYGSVLQGVEQDDDPLLQALGPGSTQVILVQYFEHAGSHITGVSTGTKHGQHEYRYHQVVKPIGQRRVIGIV